MLFSDFFLSSWWPPRRWHINWYYYVQKAPEQTGLFETVSFLKTFGYLYDPFEIGEKGNIEGREWGCRQSLYQVQETSDNAGGKPTRGFSLHWTLNRLKELRIRSGLHSRKVELSHVKYFHAIVSTFNYVSPICANNDKRRWNWDGGGLDRELSTCLTTNYKQRINSR